MRKWNCLWLGNPIKEQAGDTAEALRYPIACRCRLVLILPPLSFPPTSQYQELRLLQADALSVPAIGKFPLFCWEASPKTPLDACSLPSRLLRPFQTLRSFMNTSYDLLEHTHVQSIRHFVFSLLRACYCLPEPVVSAEKSAMSQWLNF